MSKKTMVWIGLFVGSTIGGMVPSLWGDNFLTYSSVLLTALGGIVGIYIGFKLGND